MDKHNLCAKIKTAGPAYTEVWLDPFVILCTVLGMRVLVTLLAYHIGCILSHPGVVFQTLMPLAINHTLNHVLLLSHMTWVIQLDTSFIVCNTRKVTMSQSRTVTNCGHIFLGRSQIVTLCPLLGTVLVKGPYSPGHFSESVPHNEGLLLRLLVWVLQEHLMSLSTFPLHITWLPLE